MSNAVRIIVAILLGLFSLGVLLPTAIAIARNHPQTGSIAVWNTIGLLLFGIGWFVALVKALTDGSNSTTTVIVNNVITQNNSKSSE